MNHNTVEVSVQEPNTSPKPESIDATNTKEETADSDQFITGHSNSDDSYRPGNSLQQISHHPSEDNFARQQQVTSIHNNSSDEIPH